ncbi:MMPL family transporter [Gordonia sp. (in: high G+C Gram-positive bacteria)]|uniref:MMPL family transporter n=1 Tax=Gordonia sp. (in: high G+C Gram-positive bacteria) TaxID=84139 RepID=UPI001695F138|nr:MMPL family transporter [Gordonia sp. (in: high G+C Gram-positive bacteria)]NLG46226.1 MMPL family transporter [Gordonia sp. (in: high G+C Gram-positive bacteria)]
MITRLTERVIAAPKLVLTMVVVVLALCGAYGLGAADKMLAGGFEDPNAESSHARDVLDQQFHRGGATLVVKIDGAVGTDMSTSPEAAAVGQKIVAQLEATDYIEKPILNVWADPSLAGELLSRDKTSTLIIAGVAGGDELAPGRAEDLSQQLTGTTDGFEVSVGGQALMFSQVNEQTSKDLLVAEAIAIPISFLLLIVVFGGVIAASLPVLIGVASIVGTLAFLRLVAGFTDVSIFALNLTTAMGLALAIDYTLLIVTRYREELERGLDRRSAIIRTMDTAGRTVLFSGITVGLSLAALAIFPMYFLRSFAYAGIGVVVVAVLAALVITPALLMLLGERIDALNVRAWIRRRLGRPEPQPKSVEQTGWYRVAMTVLRRAVPVAIVVPVILLVLGAPFLGIKFGFPDERVLPASASAHAVQQEIDAEYAQNSGGTVTAVVDGAVTDDALREYAVSLSKVEGVGAVTTPIGVVVDGRQVAPGNPADRAGDLSLITISSAADPLGDDGQDQIQTLRDVPAPPGVEVRFTGMAAMNFDVVQALFTYLPWVLVVIAVTTYILLFLFSGSVVLPIKALVLNVLSLSATFGAMVWIFQDGHLGAFGTTPTGYLVATMPVLMFCIAFGLSMDYEVFLLGRIREEWLKSDKTKAANDHAVAVGLARTGRVVTAAALLMSIVFAGIAASEVSFMRMFGVGLTIAVLMDASIIRMLLVPAFMRIMGVGNWWAPAPLRKLHDRIGFTEE